MEFKSKISLLSLIFANISAIFGVMFLGWSWQAMLLAYWFESGIIGFYTLLKIGLASPKIKSLEKVAVFSTINNIQKVFCLFFFPIHYGGFMFGHLFFIVYFVFSGSDASFADSFSTLVSLVPLIIMLIISHGISFYFNYYKKEEYTRTASIIEMFKPYKRIFVMHFTILAVGFGFASFSAESRIGVIVPAIILIVSKTIFDAFFHIRESMEESVLSNFKSMFKQD